MAAGLLAVGMAVAGVTSAVPCPCRAALTPSRSPATRPSALSESDARFLVVADMTELMHVNESPVGSQLGNVRGKCLD